MPVYKFSHQLLAVLVHLAHTAVKWKTNFLILDVGDKLVNTDDTALMKYEKKFMQKAVSIMYTVFSFKKEHGRCFHPKSLLRRSKSHSLAPCLLYVSITLFTVPVIGYDAAVGVPSCIRLYIDALCMALASVDIFHAVTATEEHVRHG